MHEIYYFWDLRELLSHLRSVWPSLQVCMRKFCFCKLASTFESVWPGLCIRISVLLQTSLCVSYIQVLIALPFILKKYKTLFHFMLPDLNTWEVGRK